MNRQERREKHTFSGVQLENVVEHSFNDGFSQGKIATIAKMTEIYSVAAAHAIYSDTRFSKAEAKELIENIVGNFTKFIKGEVDYDDAKKEIEEQLQLSFKMLPEEVSNMIKPK